jgi:hypothetical protein
LTGASPRGEKDFLTVGYIMNPVSSTKTRWAFLSVAPFRILGNFVPTHSATSSSFCFFSSFTGRFAVHFR